MGQELARAGGVGRALVADAPGITMTVLDAVVHIAGLVLAVAGVGKLIEPGPVDRALRSAGWPSGRMIARAIGAGEVATGAAVLAVGGRVSAALLVAVYTGFELFIVSNRARGLHVPCGCFGESSDPPGVFHLLVNGVAIVAGALAVAWPVEGAITWLDRGVARLAVLGVVVAGAVAVVVGLGVGSRVSPR